MSDFNRDDSPIESSSGQEPRKYKKLSSDELIALFLAFTGIGAILFWTLGQKNSPINLGALGNGGTPFMSADASRSASPNAGAETKPDATQDIKTDAKAEAKPANSTGAIAPADNKLRPIVTPPPSETPASDKTTASDKPTASAPDSKPDTSAPQTEPAKTAIVPAPTTSKSPTQPTVEKPGPAKTFSDVADDFWAKPAILALSSRGVIGGFEDGTYKPNQPINRGQFAAMVQKAFEKPRIKEAMTFKDIKSSSPMTPAIEEATRTGFMNGYPNGEFRPEQSIPRFEMLSAIATGLKLKPQGDPVQALAKYSDASEIPKWAIPKISSAIEADIILPNQTQLEPQKVATRADAASYIYQALIKEGKIKP